MKSLLAKICFKKVLHEAKLVSIFQQTFYCGKQTCLQHFQQSGDRVVQERIKIMIKRNKAGKEIDLKLYNVSINIWIKTLGKTR